MEFKDPDIVRIEVLPLIGISVKDTFFDSLREDYEEFDSWFNRVAREGRKAWVVNTGTGCLDTLCIYKVEFNGDAINDAGETLPGRFLKLCTLKVTKNGMRFGERLLYVAFLFALSNGLTHIYAQVRKSGHERVKALLKRFGFVEKGSYRNDYTYVKDMTPGLIPLISVASRDNFEYFRHHYPYHLDGGAIRKFFVSIDVETHEHLFPDAQVQNLPLEAHSKGLEGEVNAIRKAIVQNDVIDGLRPSDLLIFYRQATDSSVKGFVDHLGVVEDVKFYPQYEDIEEEVRNCLPYSRAEILRMESQERGLQVVVFWLVQQIRPGIKRMDFSAGGYDTHHRRVRRIPGPIYRDLIKPALSNFGVVQGEEFYPNGISGSFS